MSPLPEPRRCAVPLRDEPGAGLDRVPVRLIAWLHDRSTFECEVPSGRALAGLLFGDAMDIAGFALEAITHDGHPVLLSFSHDERSTCSVDFDGGRAPRAPRGSRRRGAAARQALDAEPPAGASQAKPVSW